MGIVISAAFTLVAIGDIEDVASEYEDIDLHKSGAGWVIFAAGVGIIAEGIIIILRLIGAIDEKLTVFGIVVSVELTCIINTRMYLLFYSSSIGCSYQWSVDSVPVSWRSS